jgi:hypothetical protein
MHNLAYCSLVYGTIIYLAICVKLYKRFLKYNPVDITVFYIPAPLCGLISEPGYE